MDARLALLAGLTIILAGCDTPEPEPTMDHEHDGSMTHSPGMSHNESSPYVGLLNSTLRGLSEDERRVLENGEGGGMATPAELNGYPGPKHVLALADDLGLNQSQRQATSRLFDQTNRAAKEVGATILHLYAELEEGFRNGTMNQTRLDRIGSALGDAYGELRLVHLRAHLEMVTILTPHQVALYNELRGYGAADHTTHEH